MSTNWTPLTCHGLDRIQPTALVASLGCQIRAGRLLVQTRGNASCVAVAVAELKLTLVEHLFTDRRAGLHTFFLRRIRSKADAADLAQEVYLRMLRVSDHESIRNPADYLYRVANNLVKEQAAAVDIDDAPEQEELQTLPAFDADLDRRQRIARLGVERVAAEFNRYAPKPIEIATPAAGEQEISGAFAIDDADPFVAFLRTLTGLRVEFTATQIKVSRR
jgi:hypothetical protein